MNMDETEAGFQRAVIELAEANGWMVYHVGYVKGHLRNRSSVGFPDLVLAHRERGALFAELKTTKGKVTKAQQDWADTLRQSGQKMFIWRPSDWWAIEAQLGT